MTALESTPDMYDLRMSEGIRPLYDAVKKRAARAGVPYQRFIRQVLEAAVEPVHR